MRRKTKTLNLNSETVRVLTCTELVQAVGGARNPSEFFVCATLPTSSNPSQCQSVIYSDCGCATTGC